MNSDSWMSIAEAELGTKEVDGDGNNPRVIEYHNTTSGHFKQDSVPWCSSFVNWVMTQCQIKGTGSAAARSWLKWGIAVEEPKRGCIVILKRGTSKTSGHVGFVESVGLLTIKVLGGNQSDSVCYKTFPRLRVLGYRLPIDKTPAISTNKLPPE